MSNQNTKIFMCQCEHPIQYKMKGKGKRVHNKTAKEGTYRCTVCLK